MNGELTRQLQDAVLERHDPGAPELRELELRIVPWDVVAETEQGREAFVRGAFDGIDPSRVVIEAQRHGGPLVGAGVELRQDDDAAYLRARVARTRDGDELLELAQAGVLRDVSVVFTPVPGGSRRRRDGVTERTRVELRRVAVLERGAYPGAQVVHVRSEDTAMTDQLTPAAPAELTVDAIRDAVRTVVAEAIPAPVVAIPAPSPAEPVLARAASFADLYQRVLDGDDELARALADAVTGDVPSIVRPAWVDRIASILPATRPIIAAFGRSPLPETGMELDWPTFDGDYTGRVAAQATEKTEVQSKKIVLASDKATVATYAGGLDMSWQVLRRSSPAFREIALRILATAWAQVTDTAFGAALIAKGTGTGTIPATPDGAAVHGALLAASADVDDATGVPAAFALAAPDAWLTIAKASGLLPPAYGTVNAPGVAQASTLRVEVSGLPIIRAKRLPAGAVIVSNGEAATWYEDGMFTAAQDVIAKLGTDVAVWSLGAPAVIVPAGVVKLTIGAVTTTTATK